MEARIEVYRFVQVFLLIIVSNTILYGQVLKGKILNEWNTPLVGASILNITNGKHTYSDEYGAFQLKGVLKGDTMQFSYLGYKESSIIIERFDTLLNIVLKSTSIKLEEITISSRVDALNLISDIDIQTNPVNSSQEILRKIPGLFIGQHAGGGKAEQIFLRGFDIDHGTDIHLSVDNLPINMVSHAHGQGYADLHFIIPETIDKLDFGKGPYYADKGNFNTAGFVNFSTKQTLEENEIKIEAGQFSTYRLLGMFNLVKKDQHKSYMAIEYLASNGPFESPQNFKRINLFGKYFGNISKSDHIGITTSYFTSKWDASGQIPQRAIDDGSIGRFGAIDDTEGGNTSRLNVIVNHNRVIDDYSYIKSNAYFSKYDFELYSNFTFFLVDSINGDQIRQKESRNIFGLNSEYNHSYTTNRMNGELQAGISLRHDYSNNNELSNTVNRTETLNEIQLGDISETNLGIYFNTNINIGKLTINPAIRLDYFNFQYYDALKTNYETQSVSSTIVSPKINFLYNYSNYLQLYLKSGKGFHSNNNRVVIQQDGKQILPAAYGFDIGFLWKPTSNWLLNLAYWYLFLQQEFVYVGDAGIVEPSGKTQRQGIDLSARYQPLDWLLLNLDVNYAYARSMETNGEDFIPLAPDLTLVGAINILHESGFYGGVDIRYLNDRPANEDNSIVAKGYAIIDVNAGYNWKNLNFGFQIQNLFNTDWNETQFATESKLKEEIEPVEEIHFTPGTPFFIKGIVTFSF